MDFDEIKKLYHNIVLARLSSLETSMKNKGYGKNAIRKALRNELRCIGKIIELNIFKSDFYDYL